MSGPDRPAPTEPLPGPIGPIDWPFDLRCRRFTGISGLYSGTSAGSTILRRERLAVRIDVDTRYSPDSPVLNKVSGDHFTQAFQPFPPGSRPRSTATPGSWTTPR